MKERRRNEMKTLYISELALRRILNGGEEWIQSKDSKGWHDEILLKLDTRADE
jgi:hypothetical protein